MNCPHCDTKIGIFSKALNKFGWVKTCPNCNKKIMFVVNFKKLVMFSIPVLGGYFFGLKPLLATFDLTVFAAPAILSALLVVVCTNLVSAESTFEEPQ